MSGRRTPAAVRGTRHHALVLGAAGLAVLLAATVLAALATLTEKAVEGAVQRRLASDPEAVLDVSGPYPPHHAERLDELVRAAVDRTFGGVPHHTWSALRVPDNRSAQLSVTEAAGQPRDDAGVSLVALQEESRHARLVAGRRPRTTGDTGVVETALTDVFAARLAVRPGDELRVQADDGTRLRLRVAGLYRADGRSPAVWANLNSALGTSESIALVARPALTATPSLAGNAQALWLAVPDTGGLRLGDIRPLERRADGFGGSDVSLSVFRGTRPTGELSVRSQLDDALDGLTTPIAVARAGLYVPATLLAALAAAALVLTARQIAEHRRPELALLAARGAGTPRLAWATAAQWAALAVPAGLAAPFLAGPLLRLLDRAGLIPGDVSATATPTAAWAAALLAVAVHGASLLLPTVRTVRDQHAVRRLRLRLGRFAGAQRLGADLALAAVAVLGWLQLRQYRSPVTGGGVDPVLVLAPVAMTCAAALLVLRALPLLARVTDPLARRGTGLVLPLGAWQIGRRAARHAGPALVVTLALAVAALSSTALAILDRGDHDQAVFKVGSDLRIEPSDRLAPGERRTTYAALPGARSVTPVVDVNGFVGQSYIAVTGIDTARGPAPALRPDLTDRPVPDLVTPLGRNIPAYGLPLDGAPRELPLRVRLSADGPGTPVPVRLSVHFVDADGLAHTSEVPLDDTGGQARTVRLKVPADGGGLRVVQLGLSMKGESVRRTYRLTVDRVPGLTRPAAWHDLRADAPDEHVAGCPSAKPRRLTGRAPGPVLCADRPGPGTLLDAVLRGPDTKVKYPTWSVRLGTDRARGRPAAPVLADRTLLASGVVRVGGTVTFQRAGGGTARVKVVGEIDAVPGAERDRPRLLADSRALAAQLALDGVLPGAETAWWVAADGGDATAALRAVRADPRLGTAVDVPHTRALLAADPLRQGARGGLTLCLVLAPAFAVIGFTLHTALSARARAREFALLRALGVRRRQLAAYLWTEQLALAAVAAVLGTLLGTALAALIMPVVTVDDTGRPVYPGLLTEVPWMRVVLTAGATTLLICAVVTVAARILGRVDLARVLRAGEDR
ncbi:ABC transporter permease [Streptomyces acidicola]|uniref:ABC transporter permease n=1 Tax=Streptomyces acidicola TaxID=2596892 RepID=A0A5N8X1C0_9ACTN|nr:ABC transporter permease [Streptomyces acidicola]MPY52816.1 ABC transporter permease [Streptomyces acidicola]